MSSWGCPHEFHEICQRVDGAYCRPGMRGCVLAGKIEFRDGVIPLPVWPDGAGPKRAAPKRSDE
jgi:hypothetical protein